eukprot:1051708-Prorocentrum_minimum.AAC.9
MRVSIFRLSLTSSHHIGLAVGVFPPPPRSVIVERPPLHEAGQHIQSSLRLIHRNHVPGVRNHQLGQLSGPLRPPLRLPSHIPGGPVSRVERVGTCDYFTF